MRMGNGDSMEKKFLQMRRPRNWEDEMHFRWILKNCKIIAGLGLKN